MICHSRDRDYDDIDDDDPFNPQARRIATHNPPRGQLHSFCSYSSGLGSQSSLQPPTQTISNAPVSEYMYGRAPNPASGSTAFPGPRGEWGLPVWSTEPQVGGKALKPSLGPLTHHLPTPTYAGGEPTRDGWLWFLAKALQGLRPEQLHISVLCFS